MTANDPKIIVSASRRTDIPAFFMPWFMRCVDRGFFQVTNPYNRKVSQVPATIDRVHTIVFWSKNFAPFLDGYCGETLTERGYHLLFNFTVNSSEPMLEPCVPPLGDRLEQLSSLARRFGPETVQWRFDPLCFYRDESGRRRDNLGDFQRIAKTAADIGIQRCITSFMDHYRKIDRRLARRPGFRFLDPPIEKKTSILRHLAADLGRADIDLLVCCEKEVFAGLPPGARVLPGACISGDYIEDLFGGAISKNKDRGQRQTAGCGCSVSTDIGSYDRHRCRHGCLYCYARPTETAFRPQRSAECDA